MDTLFGPVSNRNSHGRNSTSMEPGFRGPDDLPLRQVSNVKQFTQLGSSSQHHPSNRQGVCLLVPRDQRGHRAIQLVQTLEMRAPDGSDLIGHGKGPARRRPQAIQRGFWQSEFFPTIQERQIGPLELAIILWQRQFADPNPSGPTPEVE